MKYFTGMVTLLSVCALAAAYTDLNDSLDVDALVKDKSRVQEYMECFLDRSPCTAESQAFKSHIKEAVFDGCKECNDIERHMLKVLIQTVKTLAKKDYEEFRAKFDPNNHFDTTFAVVQKF